MSVKLGYRRRTKPKGKSKSKRRKVSKKVASKRRSKKGTKKKASKRRSKKGTKKKASKRRSKKGTKKKASRRRSTKKKGSKRRKSSKKGMKKKKASKRRSTKKKGSKRRKSSKKRRKVKGGAGLGEECKGVYKSCNKGLKCDKEKNECFPHKFDPSVFAVSGAKYGLTGYLEQHPKVSSNITLAQLQKYGKEIELQSHFKTSDAQFYLTNNPESKKILDFYKVPYRLDYSNHARFN
jgi:hypothetical protein